MRDKVRFPAAMLVLMLSAGCAQSGAPSGSDAGAATGGATTTPPATVSSNPANPDAPSAATAAPKVAVTLFKNVRIFDGQAEKLTDASNVMVRGNIIERVSSAAIQAPADANVTVIDGGGRTLMPGLIDAHWHAMLIRPTPAQGITGDVGYNNIVAGAEATDTLLRGFTTVRDVGGPSFGLKQAIDEGIIAGPRIFPSGAFITVTSGHGDFRQLSELPRTIGGPLSRGRIAVTPVRTGPLPTTNRPSPEMSVLYPTSTPATSVMAFSGPGLPSKGIPRSRARGSAECGAEEFWATSAIVLIRRSAPQNISRRHLFRIPELFLMCNS